jgi:hypothetical protein
MLTFVSGLPTDGRDKVIVAQRDPSRPALFFIEGNSYLPQDHPEAPVTDIWRNGDRSFNPYPDVATQFVRIQHDTDQALIAPVISRALMSGLDAQILILYDATNKLFAMYPALRNGGAVIAADPHLNVAEGDRVIFTRGGSFAWRDYVIEAQTATLVNDESIDLGIVDETLTQFDY